MPNAISIEERKGLIKLQSCFAGLTDQEAMELASLLVEQSFKAEEIIVSQGKPVDSIFFIVSGEAKVVHEWIDEEGIKQLTTLTTLSAGEAIGLSDYGFYSVTGVRSATVLAATDVLLLRLSVALFHGFCLVNSNVLNEMNKQAEQMLHLRQEVEAQHRPSHDAIKKTKAVDIKRRKALLKEQRCFAILSDKDITEIADLLEEFTYEAGQVIVIEGQLVDSVFLIASGVADVRHIWIDEHGLEKITSLSRVKAGESIGLGDYGFYSVSGVRSATVVAETEVVALCLNVALFNGFSLTHGHVLTEMQKYAERILQLNQRK